MGDAELGEATVEHISALKRYAPSAIPQLIDQAHHHHGLAIQAGDAAQIAGMERLLAAI